MRTSGESRLSDFMLWQCATAQLAFVPAMWPDFSYLDFVGALVDYQLGYPAMQARPPPPPPPVCHCVDADATELSVPGGALVAYQLGDLAVHKQLAACSTGLQQMRLAP